MLLLMWGYIRCTPSVGERILQNLDENLEMCDSKWTTRQEPKIVEEAESCTQNTPTPARENNTP